MRTRTFVPSFLIALAPLLALAPAGCATTEEAQASREQGVAARDQLARTSLELETRLATLAPDDPARPSLEAQLDRTQSLIATLSSGIATIDATLNSPGPPADPVVDALSAVLPAPWRAPLLLGGVGLGLFIRSRQLRAGITTIAQGIEIAKSQDPLFQASFQRHANIFRSIQSPLARKLVDTVTDRVVPTAQHPVQPPSQSSQASTPSPEFSARESSEKPAATYSQS